MDKDFMTTEELEKKKKFEELLNKQQSERVQQKEQKKLMNEQNKDPKELMLNIQKEFKQMQESVQKKLLSYKTLNLTIEDIFLEFNVLKNYFVNTNYALTTYDKQQYKEQLDSLEKQLYDLKDVLQPRKKFHFTKRNNLQTKPLVDQNKNQDKDELPKQSLHLVPGIENIKGQILRPEKEELKSIYRLENIVNSEIYLNAAFEAVYIKNIVNSKICIGPAKSSVFIDNIQNSELQVAGHQIRIHNCNKTKFAIFTPTKCIIENCKELVFSPYKYEYQDLLLHFQESAFEGKNNFWREIQDFNWLKQEKSPNFELIE